MKLYERWKAAANKLHEAAIELVDLQTEYAENEEVPESLLEDISNLDIDTVETIAADVSDIEFFERLEKCGE